MKSSSSLQKILKTDGHYQGDLVTLDFKSESLNKFLENVVKIVNQHSQRINQIEMEKITTETIKKSNQKLMIASKVPTSMINELPMIKQTSKVESYEDVLQGFAANLQLNGHATQYFYESLKNKEQRIAQLNAALNGFQRAEAVRENIKKTQQAGKKYTDDQISKVVTRIKQFEMKTNKKIADFQNTTKQLEKKTLWKISECESVMLKKVTAQYVEKACDQLQSKMHNDIKNNRNQDLNEIKFSLETARTKLESLTKDFDEKERENKHWLKELEENAKLLERKEKIDSDKRQMETRLKEVLIKIDRLQKREDPQDVELRINKDILELREKNNSNAEKIKKVDFQLDSINNVMSSMSVEGGMDPHKLCGIDGDVKKLKDSNRTNESKIRTLEDELKTKLLIFEERIMATLGMLKGQDNFVSREEMYESLSRLRQPVTERLTQNQNLIHELSGKVNKLQLFEKATKRKIKDLTKGDELNKILQMKMNIGQAEAQFNAVNMKLQNLQIIFNKTKMEVEAYAGFLKELQDEMNDPEEGINILGPKSKVFPAKCLGCGTKHVPPVYDNNMMMGTDGKYYKVDLKGSYTYDQKEVYGVTPSQIALYDNNSSTAKKSRITSAHRPTTSRSNMRPNSASKF